MLNYKMKNLVWIVTLLSLPAVVHADNTASKPVLVSHQCIWNEAPHNAFTDLVRFDDRWYCVFREGSKHVSKDGALRVLTSTHGDRWSSAALITSKDSDLRDAKITVTPEGRLMLLGAEAIDSPAGRQHQSLVWFSENGTDWSDKRKVGDVDNWLWRTTWHRNKVYGFGYDTGKGRGLKFYGSADGKSFERLIAKVNVEGTYPNETSMAFLDDDTAYCLLRQDGEPKQGYLGKSRPPYKQWHWTKLNIRIGGPDMIQLPDDRIMAAVRLYDKPVRTSLCWLDLEQGTLTEALKLPSGGDTSYAGMVWHDDMLWVSYYSSHEGKTSIYLAKVRFDSDHGDKK
ncbi:exo-alpha-sialidase [Stieleria marina]|uniref:Exo-alpha-sialidase n=1 Tax=Stieleria marina TaxID=1930275 RepID=A0A517NXC6_9BACT|nr:hypothetical protein K239x_37460 [Planctomycetes bacterium K23_9]